MRVINKKAKFNYKLFETYEAGISLVGVEVKTLLNGQVDLTNSYVKIINGEAYLINANIPISEGSGEPTRTRKLLIHKAELTSIWSKIREKQLTLIPTKMYTRGRRIKLEFALAKSKREFEKRQASRNKDIEREIAQEVRGKNI